MLVAIGVAALLVTAVAVIPMAMVGGASMLFAAGVGCPSSGFGAITQPAVTTAARNSIPADYLALFKKTGQQYGVPWCLLAGISKVESNDGQSNLPGVHSGQNGFWCRRADADRHRRRLYQHLGRCPRAPGVRGRQRCGHRRQRRRRGQCLRACGYAIAGAAKYLLAHGVQNNVSGAIFAYNHLQSYVQTVLYWAGVYSRGGYTESNTTTVSAPECLTSAQTSAVPNQLVSTVIGYARGQLGKPYLWGGTGPDSVRLLRADDDGLPGGWYISIPRTSQQQWAWGPKIPASQVQPGDLVFFAGSDGTSTDPGHVGLVIGKGMMIEAYATGFPIRISAYGTSAQRPATAPWSASPARGPTLASGSRLPSTTGLAVHGGALAGSLIAPGHPQLLPGQHAAGLQGGRAEHVGEIPPEPRVPAGDRHDRGLPPVPQIGPKLGRERPMAPGLPSHRSLR